MPYALTVYPSTPDGCRRLIIFVNVKRMTEKRNIKFQSTYVDIKIPYCMLPLGCEANLMKVF